VVSGYGEMLLQPEQQGKGATVFGAAGKSASVPAATIMRALGDVMEDFVEIDGKPIKFANLLAALAAFFEKWRIEDENKPPQRAAFVEMQPPLPKPPGEGELPPPLNPAQPVPTPPEPPASP
jgi:hypothetical protein